MISWFEAVALGLLEGITEFLPISSTAHLTIAATLLRVPQTEFVKTFIIAIQLGAIAAVTLHAGQVVASKPRVIGRIIMAFIPTALIGLALYSFIKVYLVGNIVLNNIALIAGGVFLLIFESYHQQSSVAVTRLEEVSFIQAFWIGLFQSLAVIPGVSRAAATIVGGLLVGLERKTVVEFSFLLAIPTMIGAVVLDLFKTAGTIGANEYILLGVGFVAAFGSALVVTRWFLNFIKHHNLVWFGWYRIAVGFFMLLLYRG